MQVTSAGGMKVNIASGSCFINGYCGYSDGENVTLNVGDSNNVRYDAILARLDLKKRDIHIEVIEGDYSDSKENAEKPLPLQNEMYHDLILAYVFVGSGVSEISASEIYDTRPDNQLCGLVTGVINQISTTELFNQFHAEWNKFIESLGESDNVTIMTIDDTARATAKSAVGSIPLSTLMKLS